MAPAQPERQVSGRKKRIQETMMRYHRMRWLDSCAADKARATPRRRPRAVRLVGCVALLCALAGCGISDPATPKPEPTISRVRVTGTELLEAPLMGNDRAKRPERLIWLENSASGEKAIGFYLHTATTEPSRVRIRLVDMQSASTAELHAVTPAVSARTDPADALSDTTIRQRLNAGEGVFWLAPAAAPAHRLGSRFGVLIPQRLLGAITDVQVFASTTSGDAPLGGDHFELVRDFFYMAVLGDSAMWGNGLREVDKFSTLTARKIERETGRKVIRLVYAVSGAHIVPEPHDAICVGSCTGEAPQHFTSVTLQAQSIPRPEALDLVLMDGCGNDIGLATILMPEDRTEEIAERASAFCMGAMSNLLIRVRALAPQAPIVVTGYFPFLSLESDLSDVGVWAESQGIDLADLDDIAPNLLAVAENSRVFHEASTAALSTAVDLVGELAPDDPPIRFADAGFGPQNATFAADAWLWGLTNDRGVALQLGIELDIVPEDPLTDFRVRECFDPDLAPDPFTCVYGSVGHPNPAGARAYAQAVEDALRDMGVLPAAAP